MIDPVVALRAATAAVFVAMAVAAALRWRGQRHLGNGWAAAAFLSLAAVLGNQVFNDGADMGTWQRRAVAALVILMPYFLFRFSAAFSPASRYSDGAALASTGGLLLVTATLPVAESARGSMGLYLIALFLHWTILLGVTAVKLWRLGKGAPAVPRKRVRLLSVAATVLVVAMTISIVVPVGRPVIQLLIGGLIPLSAVAFYLGFAPPRSLRLLWREAEQDRLRRTIETLVSSPTVESLVTGFLPQAADLVGADALTLIDSDDAELASCGISLESGDRAERTFEIDLPRDVRLRVAVGRTSPHFGEDELQILRSVGSLAVLSMDRIQLHEQEFETRVFAESANASLEKQIAERRAAEEEAVAARAEAERANKAKSEFLSRMSHELRTPLNSIIGFTQLLETEIEQPEQLENLSYIRKAGGHLLSLINEVLDLSRIESDRLSMSVEAVQVSEVVTEAAELVIPMTRDNSLEMSVDPSSDMSLCVAADRQRLKQVLLNLLSNAVKYNRPEGSIRISWTSKDDRALIAVTDTGWGISEEQMHRLFQPFDRLGAEASEVEGTGLGLALSKRLVEMMGGTLTATSDENGSTFFIELAVEAFAIPHGSIELDEKWSGSATGSDLVVLYIEDNLANLTLVEHVLRRRPNLGLLTAMQASMGLQLAADHRPDVILLDLHLPDMPGDRVLKMLKEDPRTSSIPVVMVTADATPGQSRRLLSAGAADYVTKPIDIHRFLEVIDRITGGVRSS